MENKMNIGNTSTTGTKAAGNTHSPSGATTTPYTHTPNMATPTIRQTEKKIGKTTYVVTTGFNGNKERSIGATLARIICRDVSSGNSLSKIGA